MGVAIAIRSSRAGDAEFDDLDLRKRELIDPRIASLLLTEGSQVLKNSSSLVRKWVLDCNDSEYQRAVKKTTHCNASHKSLCHVAGPKVQLETEVGAGGGYACVAGVFEAVCDGYQKYITSVECDSGKMVG